MSHTVKIQTQFSDLNTLRKAFESLGWFIQEKAQVRSYADNESKTFDYVAVNPEQKHNSYDIGITDVDGKLDLFTDFYGGSIASQLGQNLGKLKQQYALHVIEDEYFATGATVKKTETQNGSWLVEIEEN